MTAALTASGRYTSLDFSTFASEFLAFSRFSSASVWYFFMLRSFLIAGVSARRVSLDSAKHFSISASDSLLDFMYSDTSCPNFFCGC